MNFLIAQAIDPSSFIDKGAMGVLALMCVILLLLFWRSDKRNQQYAGAIEDLVKELTRSRGNEQTLIDVVSKNTEAHVQVAGILAAMQRNGVFRCPFAKNEKETA